MAQQPIDRSNGYEAVAEKLIAVRDRSNIGVSTVRAWAGSLPVGASILDIGCGHGVPISAVLMNEGFAVYGIDASPSLVAEFRRRFPQAEVACEPAEDSSFFGRTFDAIVAVGLMFLLSVDAQRKLIRRAAAALKPGGRFLFTAPTQHVAWADMLTGHPSVSLGAEEYKRLLADAGLIVSNEYEDEGGNHYHDSIRH